MMSCRFQLWALLVCVGVGVARAVDTAVDENSFMACMRSFATESCGQGTATVSIGLYRCHLLLNSSDIASPLRVLVPDAYVQWLLPTLERFSVLYGVDLELDVRPLEQLVQLVQAAVQLDVNQSEIPLSSQSYDVWLHPIDQTLQLANAGLLTDLSHLVELVDHNLAWQGIAQRLRLQLATYEGATVAVPLDGATLLTLYRQDVLAAAGLQVPATWQQLLGFVDAYARARQQRSPRESGGLGQQEQQREERRRLQQEAGSASDVVAEDLPPYALCLPQGAACSQASLLQAIWSSLAQTRGPQQGVHFDPADPALLPLLDTPASREAFRLLARLQAAAAPPEPDEGCWRGSLAFARGRCALVLAGFAPQMRMLLDPKSNASVVQSAVRVSRLPGSEQVWRPSRGNGSSGVSEARGESDDLVGCTEAACPFATPVGLPLAAAASGASVPSVQPLSAKASEASEASEVAFAAGEQSQQVLVNYAPLLPASLLVGSVSSRSSAIVQLLSYEVLAHLASPSRYGDDAAVNATSDVDAGTTAYKAPGRRLAAAAAVNAVSAAPPPPPPRGLPPPISPLVSTTPVRLPYLLDRSYEIWIQAGYDADLVRSALPVMAEAVQHPNPALGLRMPGAGYYNGLLEGILAGLKSGRIIDTADASPQPLPPPSQRRQRRSTAEVATADAVTVQIMASRRSAQMRRRGSELGPDTLSSASLPATQQAAQQEAQVSAQALAQVGGQGQDQDQDQAQLQGLQTLEAALAAAQARAAAYYTPEVYRSRYLASLALSQSTPSPGAGASNTAVTGGTARSQRELVTVVVSAVVASLVGGALLVAAGAAAALRLPEGSLRRLGRRVARRWQPDRYRRAYRRKPSDMSVSTHPQVKVPVASSETAILVTDIQSSTKLWEHLPTEVMNAAVQLHHACVRRLMVEHEGYESATEGDSFILAFRSVKQAVSFALELQAQLLVQPWPEVLLRDEVCMPIYTDLPEGFPFTHHSEDGGLLHGVSGNATAATLTHTCPLAAFGAAAFSANSPRLCRSSRCSTPRHGAGPGSIGFAASPSARGLCDSHGGLSRASALSASRPPTPSAASGTGPLAVLGGGGDPRARDPRVADPQLQPQREVSLLSGFSVLPSRTRAGRAAGCLASFGQLSGNVAVSRPAGLGAFGAGVLGAAGRSWYSGGDGTSANGGDDGGGAVRRFVLKAPVAAATFLAHAAARTLHSAFRRKHVASAAESHHLPLNSCNLGRRNTPPLLQPTSRFARTTPPPLARTTPSFLSLGSGGDVSNRPSATLYPPLIRPPLLLTPTSACTGHAAADGECGGEDGTEEHLSTASDANALGRDSGAAAAAAAAAAGAAECTHAVSRMSRPTLESNPPPQLPPLLVGSLAERTGAVATEAPLPPRSFSSGAVGAAADAASPCTDRLHLSDVGLVIRQAAALCAETLNTAAEVPLDETEEAGEEPGDLSGALSPAMPVPPPGKTLGQLLLELRRPAFTLHEAEGRARRLLMFRGLRVRVGIHAGVSSEAELVYNAASARIMFSGPCVATCKVVADLAHGGQIFLSEAARAALEAATHHHNGGRPAGTLMLQLGTYFPEQGPALPACLASPAGSMASAACPSALRAGPSRALSRAVSGPASGPCSRQPTRGGPALSAAVSARAGGGGRPSLELAGLQSARSRTSAVPIAPQPLQQQPHQRPLKPAETSVYWITSPSLSQRLALVPPPRAPPKGFRTMKDVYEAPVGRVSYVVVKAPATAALLAWDETVTREALELFASEAAEQLRAVRGGYMSVPHPGEVCAAFTSAASAVRWAEGLRLRLLDARWPQELLAHEMCEAVEVSESDYSSTSSGSSSGSSSPRTAAPSPGAPSAGYPGASGGGGGGRTYSGLPSLRGRLSAVSSALLHHHHHHHTSSNHISGNDPYVGAPSSQAGSASVHSFLHHSQLHRSHHSQHHHHHHHLHHAHTHDALLRQQHHQQLPSGYRQGHSHQFWPGPPSRHASCQSDLSSGNAAGGLAAWISLRLKHHLPGGPPSALGHLALGSPSRPAVPTASPSPTLALPPRLPAASPPVQTPFSTLAAAAAAAAVGAGSLGGADACGGGGACSPATVFSHGPSRLGLMAVADAFAHNSAMPYKAHSVSLTPYKLPTDVGYVPGSFSGRRRVSAMAAVALAPQGQGATCPVDLANRATSSSTYAYTGTAPLSRAQGASQGEEDEEGDEVMALMVGRAARDPAMRQLGASLQPPPRLSVDSARGAHASLPAVLPAGRGFACLRSPRYGADCIGGSGLGSNAPLSPTAAARPYGSPMAMYGSSGNEGGADGGNSGESSGDGGGGGGGECGGGGGGGGGEAAAPETVDCRDLAPARHELLLATVQCPSNGAGVSASLAARTPKSPAELPADDTARMTRPTGAGGPGPGPTPPRQIPAHPPGVGAHGPPSHQPSSSHGCHAYHTTQHMRGFHPPPHHHQLASSALEVELRHGGIAAGSPLPAGFGSSDAGCSFPPARMSGIGADGMSGCADGGVAAGPDSLNDGMGAAQQVLDEILPQRLPPRGLPVEYTEGDGADDSSQRLAGVEGDPGAAGASAMTATQSAAQRGRRLLLRGLRIRAGIATGVVSWTVADHTHQISYSGKPVRTALRLAASGAASGRVLCCAVTCAEAVAVQAAERSAAAALPVPAPSALGLSQRRQQRAPWSAAAGTSSALASPAIAPMPKRTVTGAGTSPLPDDASPFCVASGFSPLGGASGFSPNGTSGASTTAAVAATPAAGAPGAGGVVMAFAPLEAGAKRRKSTVFVCGLYRPADLSPVTRHATLSGWCAAGASASSRGPAYRSQLSSARTVGSPQLSGLVRHPAAAHSLHAAAAIGSPVTLLQRPIASGPLLTVAEVQTAAAVAAAAPSVVQRPASGAADSRSSIYASNCSPGVFSCNSQGDSGGGSGRSVVVVSDRSLHESRRTTGSRLSPGGSAPGTGAGAVSSSLSSGGGWYSRTALFRAGAQLSLNCRTAAPAAASAHCIALPPALTTESAAGPVAYGAPTASLPLPLPAPASQLPCPPPRGCSRLSGRVAGVAAECGSGAAASGSGGIVPGSYCSSPSDRIPMEAIRAQAKSHRLRAQVPYMHGRGVAHPAEAGCAVGEEQPRPCRAQAHHAQEGSEPPMEAAGAGGARGPGASHVGPELPRPAPAPALCPPRAVLHQDGTATGRPEPVCSIEPPAGLAASGPIRVGYTPSAEPVQGTAVQERPAAAAAPGATAEAKAGAEAEGGACTTGAALQGSPPLPDNMALGWQRDEERRGGCRTAPRSGQAEGGGKDGVVDASCADIAPLPMLLTEPGRGGMSIEGDQRGGGGERRVVSPSGRRWLMVGMSTELLIIGATCGSLECGSNEGGNGGDGDDGDDGGDGGDGSDPAGGSVADEGGSGGRARDCEGCDLMEMEAGLGGAAAGAVAVARGCSEGATAAGDGAFRRQSSPTEDSEASDEQLEATARVGAGAHIGAVLECYME